MIIEIFIECCKINCIVDNCVLDFFFFSFLDIFKNVVVYIECSLYRSSRSQMFFKTGLKNFANFTGKHLYWSLFLIKLEALRPSTLLKRDSNTGVFLFNLRNFLKHLFLQYTSAGCSFYTRLETENIMLRSMSYESKKGCVFFIFFSDEI